MTEGDPPSAARAGSDSDEASSYPAWWRRNIAEHERYGLGRYRPPRLEDGTVLNTLIRELEAEHGVDIALRVPNPVENTDAELLVDEAVVATTERERRRRGDTVYGIGSERFRELVEAQVSD